MALLYDVVAWQTMVGMDGGLLPAVVETNAVLKSGD